MLSQHIKVFDLVIFSVAMVFGTPRISKSDTSYDQESSIDENKIKWRTFVVRFLKLKKNCDPQIVVRRF